jgi:hypothetical protein
MAKSSLPSVDGNATAGPQQKQSDVPEIGSPYPTEGYIPRNVDVRMSRAQARILRDKLRALQDAGAKTADGRFVDNRAQAVRWIIENEVVL